MLCNWEQEHSKEEENDLDDTAEISEQVEDAVDTSSMDKTFGIQDLHALKQNRVFDGQDLFDFFGDAIIAIFDVVPSKLYQLIFSLHFVQAQHGVFNLCEIRIH